MRVKISKAAHHVLTTHGYQHFLYKGCPRAQQKEAIAVAESVALNATQLKRLLLIDPKRHHQYIHGTGAVDRLVEYADDLGNSIKPAGLGIWIALNRAMLDSENPQDESSSPVATLPGLPGDHKELLEGYLCLALAYESEFSNGPTPQAIKQWGKLYKKLWNL